MPAPRRKPIRRFLSFINPFTAPRRVVTAYRTRRAVRSAKIAAAKTTATSGRLVTTQRRRKMVRLALIAAAATTAIGVATKLYYDHKISKQEAERRIEEARRIERESREAVELRAEQERIARETIRMDVRERLERDPRSVSLKELEAEDLVEHMGRGEKGRKAAEEWLSMWQKMLGRVKGDPEKISADAMLRIYEIAKGQIDSPVRIQLILEGAWEIANQTGSNSKNKKGEFTLYDGDPHLFFENASVTRDSRNRFTPENEENPRAQAIIFFKFVSTQPGGRNLIREVLDGMGLETE